MWKVALILYRGASYFAALNVKCECRGRYRILKGGGAKKKCGAKRAYRFCDMGHIFRKIWTFWGTFPSNLHATSWALFLQIVPYLGRSLSKMCHNWSTFSVKCAASWGTSMRFDGANLARGAMVPSALPLYPPLECSSSSSCHANSIYRC